MKNITNTYPIYSVESNALEHKFHQLICGYNAWDTVVSFFNSNEIANKMFWDKMGEMQESGNCGISTCVHEVLEKVFYDLEE